MAIKKFQDLQVEYPQRYEVTDNAGTENLKTIKFSPGKVYQEGTKETAVIFNNIQKNGLYTVIGTRVIEGNEEIYDVELEGLEEFGIFDINLQLVANSKNTTNSPKLRILNEKYSFVNNNGTISVGDLTTNNIHVVKIDTVKKTAFLIGSDKLDKGTYTGDAGKLKEDIDEKMSKYQLRYDIMDYDDLSVNGFYILNGSFSGVANSPYLDPALVQVWGYGDLVYQHAVSPYDVNKQFTRCFQIGTKNTKWEKIVNTANYSSMCPYSIGDILLTASNQNPAVKWVGTTWEKIEGRFLLSTSGNGTSGTTGGSNTKTISKANLPNVKLQVDSFSLSRGNMDITGTFAGYTVDRGSCVSGAFTSDNTTLQGPYQVDDKAEGQNITTFTASRSWTGMSTSASPYTSALGSGTPLDITPSFYTVHIWKRLT